MLPTQSARVLPIYRPQVSDSSDPAPVNAPHRLKSPFQLSPSPMGMQSSPARQSSRRTSRLAGCRRHCSRADCPFQSILPNSFDSLPWIAAVELPSDKVNAHDIADLSQLPVRSVGDCESRPGPVRRRKTAPRRSPLSPGHSPHYNSASPACVLPPLLDRSISSPCTPRPRASHPHIAFHDLMPIFTYDAHKFRSANLSSPDH